MKFVVLSRKKCFRIWSTSGHKTKFESPPLCSVVVYPILPVDEACWADVCVRLHSYLGRGGEDDPLLDPRNNPNIRQVHPSCLKGLSHEIFLGCIFTFIARSGSKTETHLVLTLFWASLDFWRPFLVLEAFNTKLKWRFLGSSINSTNFRSISPIIIKICTIISKICKRV